jgi:hypothetical protein
MFDCCVCDLSVVCLVHSYSRISELSADLAKRGRIFHDGEFDSKLLIDKHVARSPTLIMRLLCLEAVASSQRSHCDKGAMPPLCPQPHVAFKQDIREEA